MPICWKRLLPPADGCYRNGAKFFAVGSLFGILFVANAPGQAHISNIVRWFPPIPRTVFPSEGLTFIFGRAFAPGLFLLSGRRPHGTAIIFDRAARCMSFVPEMLKRQASTAVGWSFSTLRLVEYLLFIRRSLVRALTDGIAALGKIVDTAAYPLSTPCAVRSAT